MGKSLNRYIANKVALYLAALVVAVALNFFLPRLIPGNPVDVIVGQFMSQGGSGASGKAMYKAFMQQFGLDKPLLVQFWIYVKDLVQGNLGQSFSLYPAQVTQLMGQALPWSLALQLPAILLGWLIGNLLGALAAYKRGVFDRTLFVSSLAMSSIPYYAFAIILLYLFAVLIPIFPAGGGYTYGTFPSFTPVFIWGVLTHYFLPFVSLILISIGTQAVGMRSMAIYELGSDYVNYSVGLGVREDRILAFVFRNAMLPQISGLALALGRLVGGALITEIVFSYPGIGTLLFNAITANDYPLIQGVTLLIIIGVLLANFVVDILYGFIDPRIRAASMGER